MSLVALEELLLLAVRAEPYAIGLVNTVVTIIHSFRTQTPIPQVELDQARADTKASVAIFDQAVKQ